MFRNVFVTVLGSHVLSATKYTWSVLCGIRHDPMTQPPCKVMCKVQRKFVVMPVHTPGYFFVQIRNKEKEKTINNRAEAKRARALNGTG